MWPNILIFKFIVLRLLAYSVLRTILEQFGNCFYRILGTYNLGNQIKNLHISVPVKNSLWVLKNLDWDEIFTKCIMRHGVTNSVND